MRGTFPLTRYGTVSRNPLFVHVPFTLDGEVTPASASRCRTR
jgi:hypothetical protein